MPFVPLGARKRLDVILDDDKEAIVATQRARDNFVIATHFAYRPSAAGYRFGNHPATQGRVRGPDMPFVGATALWRPPEEDPSGPAGQRVANQAKSGAFMDGSHLKKTGGSCPDLRPSPTSTLSIMQEVADPLVVERKRWEKMAAFSAAQELKDCKPPEDRKLQPRVKKELVKTGGLVNFPKYMLINNCHLKMVDQQRFVEEEQRKRQLAEERLEEAKAALTSPVSPSSPGSHNVSFAPCSEGEVDSSASGQTLGKVSRGKQFAGSTMPAGGGSRTSNPFRMG